MRTFVLAMFALAGSALLAQPAQAQVDFGPQIAWGDDTDFGVGGRIDFGIGNAFGVDDGPFANLFGSAAATYFFVDCPSNADCSYFEIDGNLAVPFTLEGNSLRPYAGAGIHVARWSVDFDGVGIPGADVDDTEVGLNLLGGIFFPISDLDGFVQGKFGLAGAEQFVLSAGILF